jgi:23S rRNA (adenine2503-C2)-methyltransferase
MDNAMNATNPPRLSEDPRTATESESGGSLHDLSYSALQEDMADFGIRPVHTHALWRSLYADFDTELVDRQDFSPPLQRWLSRRVQTDDGFTLDRPTVVESHFSNDGLTRKFLLGLRDGRSIETVLMKYAGRFTACLSTQVGCAMGCVFCATGQMGFGRHLRPGEIVAQVLHCQRDLRSRGLPGLRNLVLMGMGEPLHNYDAVMEALEIITDTRGLNIGPGRITISTVGVVPGILRLAAERRPYHLAVSLHSALETERAALVPATRRWPLAELIDACRTYAVQTRRKIFFQWTLIAGVNDTAAHAEAVAALLAGLDAHLNLIPLNPTDGFAAASSSTSAARQFQRILATAGVPSTVRQRRGIDVSAGCGQLGRGG